jgi:hypothetical protein
VRRRGAAGAQGQDERSQARAARVPAKKAEEHAAGKASGVPGPRRSALHASGRDARPIGARTLPIQ